MVTCAVTVTVQKVTPSRCSHGDRAVGYCEVAMTVTFRTRRRPLNAMVAAASPVTAKPRRQARAARLDGPILSRADKGAHAPAGRPPEFVVTATA